MNEITREIRFEYSKEKTPVDIIKEYTLMLTAFEKAEVEVAKSISTSMQYKSSLEAVETGSVITRIKSWIEDKEPELDDGTIQNINIQKYISDGVKIIVDNPSCSVYPKCINSISTLSTQGHFLMSLPPSNYEKPSKGEDR